jgi:trk system potassium uptake protein TrkA
MNRYVIVGLGNFGSTVAQTLHEAGQEVVAIDTDEEKVDAIAPFVSKAVVGDGRQLKVLERLGAKNADAGVVSTGDDITASILTALALRDLRVPAIYVKVISRDHARVLDKIGVTETVFPERDSAQHLALRLSAPGILNYVRMGRSISLIEMAVHPDWIGKSLRELQLPRKFRVSVVAVHDILRDEVAVVPDPDAPLKESDSLLVAGREEDLAKAARVS